MIRSSDMSVKDLLGPDSRNRMAAVFAGSDKVFPQTVQDDEYKYPDYKNLYGVFVNDENFESLTLIRKYWINDAFHHSYQTHKVSINHDNINSDKIYVSGADIFFGFNVAIDDSFEQSENLCFNDIGIEVKGSTLLLLSNENLIANWDNGGGLSIKSDSLKVIDFHTSDMPRNKGKVLALVCPNLETVVIKQSFYDYVKDSIPSNVKIIINGL